jgi:hypothetical protein
MEIQIGRRNSRSRPQARFIPGAVSLGVGMDLSGAIIAFASLHIGLPSVICSNSKVEQREY